MNMTSQNIISINVGCGRTPTRGWRNFDNSISVRLDSPILAKGMLGLGLIKQEQYEFALYARENGIQYGDILRGLPL